jgi:AcrR family transcriptional regulator
MPRNSEDVRRRLQEAALELYRDQGYDQTTAAEIAARAGVTERTFFRHFPDKREVFFEGEAAFRDSLLEAIARAPAGLTPLQLLRQAYRSVEAWAEANRPLAEPRHQVIDKTPALKERQLAKTAALTTALSEALQHRGIEPRLAALAIQTVQAALVYAAETWKEEPGSPLGPHIDRAFQALEELVARR